MAKFVLSAAVVLVCVLGALAVTPQPRSEFRFHQPCEGAADCDSPMICRGKCDFPDCATNLAYYNDPALANTWYNVYMSGTPPVCEQADPTIYVPKQCDNHHCTCVPPTKFEVIAPYDFPIGTPEADALNCDCVRESGDKHLELCDPITGLKNA